MKIHRKILMRFAFIILFCSVCLGTAEMIVKAEEQTFDIDAEVLPSSKNKNTYDVQLTIENRGADWEGIVRLGGSDSYGELRGCVYDTVLSLPAGSTKQFVIKIPKSSISSTSASVKITLLDKKLNVTAQKEFKRLFQDAADSLQLGILSDEYSALTYLDMGGEGYYYMGNDFPIKLVELNQSNLATSLDTLTFLVIDTYNTSVLSEETVENIWQWVYDGGSLIVGTGSSAKDVLSGLDKLEIECPRVYETGYIYDASAYIDVSQLQLAELIDKNNMYRDGYGILSLVSSCGNGAVEILPYALSEFTDMSEVTSVYQDTISQEYFVECILDNVVRFSNVQYNTKQSSYSDNMYTLNRTFYLFGNGANQLRFGGLRWIIILYVIFVGPILYLILRFAKKRDFYWIAVPISAVVGIFLVYWAGRGFEIRNTNIYSVTVENLSEKKDAVTFLRGYDAGHKEWDLRLAEGYEYVGPNYSYYGSSYGIYGIYDVNKYYHHIKKEGDRLFFGVNPSTGFDDGYFLAGSAKKSEGSILSDITLSTQKNSFPNISGTVSNKTGRDFKYFAVIMDTKLQVYKNLPAGETVNLETAQAVYSVYTVPQSSSAKISDKYLNSLRDFQREKDTSDSDILTALGIGIAYVFTQNDENITVIIGVTEDWDNTVDDNCSEVSYGCLYAIQ